MILRGKTRKGKKFILRPLRCEESSIYHRWFSDPEVNQNYINPTDRPKTEEEEMERTKRLITVPNKYFVIEVEGKPIGVCAGPGPEKEGLGITIGEKEYRGQGYGTAAAKLLIDYGFNELGLERIESGAMEFNQRSIKMLQRAGLQETSREEKARWREVTADGHAESKFWAILHFAITKEEWLKNR